MTPKYASTATRPRSTLAQFRSFEGAGIDPFSTSPEVAWWRFMTVRGPLPKRTLDLPEERALSKATGPAGGYLVPSDLDALVTAARRSRAAIGAVARNITTENGVTFSLGAASAHGTGSWVAEAAASTPSDETFAQANLGAHKGVTSVIVSEELAQDAGWRSTNTWPTSSPSGWSRSRRQPSPQVTAPASRSVSHTPARGSRRSTLPPAPPRA